MSHRTLMRSIKWNLEKQYTPTDFLLMRQAEEMKGHISPKAVMDQYDRLLYAKLHPWRSFWSPMPEDPL